MLPKSKELGLPPLRPDKAPKPPYKAHCSQQRDATTPVRLILADDHALIRDGLRSLLAPEPNIEVIGEASNGDEVLQLVEQTPELELVLLDINMPELDGIETTQKLKDKHPEVGVLILTMYNRTEFVKNLIASGADGYVLKNSGRDTLIEAITSITQGEPYYEREITKTIMGTFQQPRKSASAEYVELSDREKEVIQLIVREYSTEQIAEKLFLSKHTVDSHRKNILGKLQVKNVAGIMRYAIQTGIVKDYEL